MLLITAVHVSVWLDIFILLGTFDFIFACFDTSKNQDALSAQALSSSRVEISRQGSSEVLRDR